MGCEMAKLRRLDINLDNTLAIYSPGDTISGQLCVDVSDDTVLHGCRIWFYGKAETSWIEVNKTEGPKTVTGHQVFFQSCTNLFGKDIHDNSESLGFTLKAGFHQFSFHFTLPSQLPSSFDFSCAASCTKAKISYSIRAEVENFRRSARHSRERQFLVLGYYDLNSHPHLVDRICLKKDISLACCCLNKGRIVCELCLSKSGYVPGETMDISIHLLNASTACIRATHISFQQKVYLSAGCYQKTANSLIFSISGQRVKAGGSGYYHDVIHVPPLPPTGMPHCEIIDVEYLVQIQIEASGSFRQGQMLELSLPVIIGNIPLHDSFIDNKQVVPCFAHFDFTSGDIVEHTASELEAQQEVFSPVYTYYKTERRVPPASANNSNNSVLAEPKKLLKQSSGDSRSIIDRNGTVTAI